MDKDKHIYLNSLIEEYSKNNKYSLGVFLLRSFFVEYALKYLLINYPYNKSKQKDRDFIDKATMGQVIGRLEALRKENNDDYLDEIIEFANDFNNLRTKVTHHFLDSDSDSIEVFEKKLASQLVNSKYLENWVHFYLDFVSDLNR
jgi:hypothetical protein